MYIYTYIYIYRYTYIYIYIYILFFSLLSIFGFVFVLDCEVLNFHFVAWLSWLGLGVTPQDGGWLLLAGHQAHGAAVLFRFSWFVLSFTFWFCFSFLWLVLIDLFSFEVNA